MFTILKSVDGNLYSKYEDIEKNISAASRTVYVSMQSFLERLLKYIVKEENLGVVESHSLTFGKLLNTPSVQRFLTLKLDFDDLELLYQINALSNEYKHATTNIIRENELFNLFEGVCMLVNAFLEFKEKKSDLKKPLKPYFEELMNRYDYSKLAIANQEIIEEKKLAFEAMKSDKDKLESELNLLKANQKEIQNATELRQKLIQRVDFLKLEIQRLKSDNQKHESQIKSLNHKNKSEGLSPEEKQKLTQLFDTLANNDRLIQTYDDEIFNSQLDVNKDQENIQKIKYETLIEEQERKIRKLTHDLSESQKNILSLQKGEKKISYQDRSLQTEKLRNLYARTKFNSNYRSRQPFEITNITLNTQSNSKYASFYAVIFNLLIRSEIVEPTMEINSLKDSQLHTIYQFQLLLLSLIRENILDDDEWHIRFNISDDSLNEKIESFNLAVENLFLLVEKISSLTKVDIQKPQIHLNSTHENSIVITFDEEIYQSNHFGILVSSVFGDESLPSLWIEDRVPYSIDTKNPNHINSLNFFLFFIFKFNSFREGQIDIISNFLNGRNTIGVLPTGAGKSLTYYFSVILQPKISLVIAPILALMKDQIDKLEHVFNLKYVTTISSMSDDNETRLQLFRDTRRMFTLVSPERLQDENFRGALVKLSNEESIGSIILDEVHCLSEWGHDFRPSYLMLSTTLSTFAPNAKYLGLTATASINVVKDIMVELRVRSGKDVKFVKKLKRENLTFKIKKFDSDFNISEDIKEFLVKGQLKDSSFVNVEKRGEKSNCGIVFCLTKSAKKATGTEFIRNTLLPYIPTTGIFDGDNKADQDAFMNNEKTLLVATKAFGMGIDKPNIRFTIHAGMPSSREAFYQEAGRAGRDLAPSYCYLISGNADNETNRDRIIQEALSLRTSITRLKEISAQSYKLLGKSDIATHIYFLAKDLEEPADETSGLVSLYNEINLAVTNSKVFIYKKLGVSFTGNDRSIYEKYFVQMQKLGIVNNYTIRYRNNLIDFTVSIHHLYNQIDHLKEKAIEYLKLYDLNNPLIQEIQRITSINELSKMVMMLRKWYHDTFTRTKREQLANIHSFINRHTQSTSDVIQEELEQFFDLSNYFKDEELSTTEFSEEDSYVQVIDKVFAVDEEEIYKKIVSTEFLIESIVNTRIDLYISLLHLRNGDTFDKDNNGRNRFEFALSNLSFEEARLVREKVLQFYPTLQDQSKLWLIESFEKERMAFAQDISKAYTDDFIANKFIVAKANISLNSIMKGEK